MAESAVNTLRAFLEANTDQKGTPLYRSALKKLEELVQVDVPPAMQRAQNMPEKVSFAEFALATPAGRFIEGAADLPLGAAQFISESLGVEGMNEFMRKREERIQRGREAIGSEGFDLARLTGNIGTGVAATAGLAPAASLAGKTAQGAGLGAVFGAASPATSDDPEGEKASQISTGTIFGGAFPMAQAAASKVLGPVARKTKDIATNIADPFLPGGAERSVRRLVQETGDMDELVTALRSGEGTAPQRAVATNNTRFEALGREVQKRRPDSAALIQKAQNEARELLLDEAGGATAGQSLDDVINTATQNRRQVTQPLYEAARNSDSAVDINRTATLIDNMIKNDPNNQKLVSVLESIKPTLSGTSPRDAISASQNLSRIMTEKGPNGAPINEAIVRQLLTVKRSLDGQIAKVTPEYKEANALFSELSVPIERAQIAQRLQQTLRAPLAGDADSVIAQRGSAFANALRDERRLVRQATGFKRGKPLEEIFDEEQMGKILTVSDQIKNDAELIRLATFGREELRRMIGDLEGDTLVNPLQRVIMVINGIIKRGGALQREQTLTKAAELFENPTQLADLLERATAAETAALKTGLSQLPSGSLIRTVPAITATQGEQ